MSNHLKPAAKSARVQERHGRKGHVPLSTSVPPDIKDDLVATCIANNRTQKDTIEAALWMFMSAAPAEQLRWYGVEE